MEYTVIIHKDDKSGWYTGKCMQVPGAMSQGRTLDELIENMKDAISLMLNLINTKNSKKVAIPRHPDINDILVKEICKELEIAYPGKN